MPLPSMTGLEPADTGTWNTQGHREIVSCAQWHCSLFKMVCTLISKLVKSEYPLINTPAPLLALPVVDAQMNEILACLVNDFHATSSERAPDTIF
jgi:hypothetical protein